MLACCRGCQGVFSHQGLMRRERGEKNSLEENKAQLSGTGTTTAPRTWELWGSLGWSLRDVAHCGSGEKKKCLAATKLSSLVSPQSCAVASFPRQESVMNVKPACTDPSWGALHMHCTGKVFTYLSSGHCPAWFSSSRWNSHKNSFCWISPNKPDSFVPGWGKQRLPVCFAWTKRVQNGRNYRLLWMLLLRGVFPLTFKCQ